MVTTLECRAAIQRDLNRLEKWADKNLKKFNKRKLKILYLGRNNPIPPYRVGHRAALQERSWPSQWPTS